MMAAVSTRLGNAMKKTIVQITQMKEDAVSVFLIVFYVIMSSYILTFLLGGGGGGGH